MNLATPLTPEGKPSPDGLAQLHDPKSLRKLVNMGGFDSLVRDVLHSDAERGLDGHNTLDLEWRTQTFGKNQLPQKLAKSFIRLCWEALQDKVLILLSVAAVVSLALGLYETFGAPPMYDDEGLELPKLDWVEGVAILVAVIIVVLVGAANDYQKERQFAKLNAKKEDREVIVVRNNEQKMISIFDLCVGDVLNVQTGDVLPADCILVLGSVECDELALTGESDTLFKVPVKEALENYRALNTTEDIGSHEADIQDPYLISGLTVLSGLGDAMVTAVGEHSMHGRTMLNLNHEPDMTPMQARLDGLATGISKYGFLVALVLFIILFIRFCVDIAPGGHLHRLGSAEKGKHFMDILITAITIIVVAVPEGLPLAVTLALAFATTRMAQNGNLVRVLKSCETMGSATAVCSDKTGTLTENRMTVVCGFVGTKDEEPLEFDDSGNNVTRTAEPLPELTQVVAEITPEQRELVCTNITINLTAFENADYDPEKAAQARIKPKPIPIWKQLLLRQKPDHLNQLGDRSEPYLGNKTESALLGWAKAKFDWYATASLNDQRQKALTDEVQVIPFESLRKWAGVVTKTATGHRVYIKGAAEIVFKHCAYTYNNDGLQRPLERTDRDLCLQKIDTYALEALRTIALAHVDYETLLWPPSGTAMEKDPNEADPDLLFGGLSSHKLVLDALVGIQDPVKDGVPEAVLQCKRAGVSVTMVTGDNLITAKAISMTCNILTAEDLTNEDAVMEGPKFRTLTPARRREVVPRLRVLARSLPEDKRILVDTKRKLGDVVAVTGDGTNDAPALRLADVGFSMGIAGTEVAREALDIILMTDDFTDIVQAIKWGRTVATSIKKFIQFQLTVNVTACVLTFVSAVSNTEGKSVLTAVQLLWVNLIMDTLAALALATDKPDDDFLNHKPAGRTAPLISVSMWKMILGQSVTQLIVTFILYFAGPRLFHPDHYHDLSNFEEKQLHAMTFNAFVWLQFWKLVVTRKLDECADVTSIRGRINRQNLDFFQHLFRNWYFIAIILIIGGCQVLIMFVGGAAFSIAHQTPGQWATAILTGFISIPAGAVIRIIPNSWVVKVFPTRAFKKFIYIVGFGWLKRKKKADPESDEEKIESEMSKDEANPGPIAKEFAHDEKIMGN